MRNTTGYLDLWSLLHTQCEGFTRKGSWQAGSSTKKKGEGSMKRIVAKRTRGTLDSSDGVIENGGGLKNRFLKAAKMYLLF